MSLDQGAIVLSTPERAVLELLDELPGGETFHQVDMLMEGLVGLSPKRTSRLLGECRSVKVKRLFLWFAERHGHPWLERLDHDGTDLGKGKRMLGRSGAGSSIRNTRSRFRRTSMPVDERYRRQAELLVRTLPHVAQEPMLRVLHRLCGQPSPAHREVAGAGAPGHARRVRARVRPLQLVDFDENVGFRTVVDVATETGCIQIAHAADGVGPGALAVRVHFEADGLTCRFVKPPRGFAGPAAPETDGVTSVDRLGMEVRVTTLARTVVERPPRIELRRHPDFHISRGAGAAHGHPERARCRPETARGWLTARSAKPAAIPPPRPRIGWLSGLVQVVDTLRPASAVRKGAVWNIDPAVRFTAFMMAAVAP